MTLKSNLKYEILETPDRRQPFAVWADGYIYWFDETEEGAKDWIRRKAGLRSRLIQTFEDLRFTDLGPRPLTRMRPHR